MADTSTKLGIPYIQANQDQPEITHNTALYMLEALLRGVIDRLNVPPGAPADGDSYLVTSVASGAWTGRENHIAIWNTGAWLFVPGFDDDGALIAIGATQEGMRVFVRDEDLFYRWTGATWTPIDQDPVFTVATLPAAATFPRGRAWVSDSNATWTAGIGAVVAAGGANVVPVKSDGTNWRIG